MFKKINHTKGQRFGGLILIEELNPKVFPSGQKRRVAAFQCECGKIFKTTIAYAKSGHTRSCGCLQKKIVSESNSTHNMSGSSIYETWNDIKRRCYNEKNQAYKDYGARGISMYSDWHEDFEKFYDYVKELPRAFESGMTIDRRDNNKGYYPKNLRWADKHIQAANKRKQKSNTSGYVGVVFSKARKKWISNITVREEIIYFGGFDIIEEAVMARNSYIIQNSLFEYPIQEIHS